MYTDSNYRGKKLIHPQYGPVDWMSEEELTYVRALYAGEVSFVDKCFGRLLDCIESHGLLDDTIIVVLSDHGHPHGDHGTIMKTDPNLYQELVRFPLMIHHPAGEGAGARCDALLQMYDVLPTVLDIAGLDAGATMHGRSVWPVVRGEREAIRDHVICGYHASPHRSVRDRDWSYIARPAGQRDELYHVPDDPREQSNLIDQFPQEAARLAAYLGRYSLIGKPATGNIQLDYEVSHTPAQ
jgi:arylsulfatase A-like enzyme